MILLHFPVIGFKDFNTVKTELKFYKTQFTVIKLKNALPVLDN